jgi:competence protein ComEA
LAARIVEQRESRGPFGSLEGLARIPGIGPSVIERIRPHATFSLLARPADTPKSVPRIRINTADEEALARLPGIGPSKARAIVEDRKAHGPFRTLEDLGRVRGIGPATLEAIAPLVVVP